MLIQKKKILEVVTEASSSTTPPGNWTPNIVGIDESPRPQRNPSVLVHKWVLFPNKARNSEPRSGWGKADSQDEKATWCDHAVISSVCLAEAIRIEAGSSVYCESLVPRTVCECKCVSLTWLCSQRGNVRQVATTRRGHIKHPGTCVMEAHVIHEVIWQGSCNPSFSPHATYKVGIYVEWSWHFIATANPNYILWSLCSTLIGWIQHSLLGQLVPHGGLSPKLVLLFKDSLSKHNFDSLKKQYIKIADVYSSASLWWAQWITGYCNSWVIIWLFFGVSTPHHSTLWAHCKFSKDSPPPFFFFIKSSFIWAVLNLETNQQVGGPTPHAPKHSLTLAYMYEHDMLKNWQGGEREMLMQVQPWLHKGVPWLFTIALYCPLLTSLC